MARSDPDRILRTLQDQCGFNDEILRLIGAFVVTWGLFESEIERAIWVMSGEEVEGKRPSTDTKEISELINTAATTASKVTGPEWAVTFEDFRQAALDLASTRNTLVHGRVMMGTGAAVMIRNGTWFGETRKRQSETAYFNVTMLHMMISALDALLWTVGVLSSSPEFYLARLAAGAARLRSARLDANEVRHIVQAMNSENT